MVHVHTEYEYAIINKTNERIILRSSSHKYCVEFLAACSENISQNYIIARRNRLNPDAQWCKNWTDL